MKHLLRTAGLILLAAITAQSAHAAPGDLDMRFGVGGEVLRPYGTSTAFTSIGQGGLLLYDAQVLTGGAPSIRARLLDANGHVASAGLGDIGIPLNDIVTPQSTWQAATLQLAGSLNGTATGLLSLFGSTQAVFRAVRIGADGRLDAAFNQATPASLNFSVYQDYAFPAPPWVQSNGSVLIRLGCNTCDIYPTPSAILELREDGGIAQRYSLLQPALRLPFDATVAAQRLADGRVVVVGNNGLLRFHPDGTLDVTFGTAGAVDARADSIRSAVQREFREIGPGLLTDYLEIRDARTDEDGKTILLMQAAVGDSVGGYLPFYFLLRIDAVGRFDPSFGANGNGIAAPDLAAIPLESLAYAAGGVLAASTNGRLTAALDVRTLYGASGGVLLWRIDGDGHPLSGAGLPALQMVPPVASNLSARGGILGGADTGAIDLMTERSVIRLSDDSPASPGILASSGLFVEEDILRGTETVRVPVTRMMGSSGHVTLQFATSVASTGVSATAGEDYIATSGQLEWADGETGTRFIPLQVINDTLTERAMETIQINLTGTSGGALRAADAILVNISASDVTETSPAPPASTTPTPSPPVTAPNAGGSGGGGRFDAWMLLLLGLSVARRLVGRSGRVRMAA